MFPSILAHNPLSAKWVIYNLINYTKCTQIKRAIFQFHGDIFRLLVFCLEAEIFPVKDMSENDIHKNHPRPQNGCIMNNIQFFQKYSGGIWLSHLNLHKRVVCHMSIITLSFSTEEKQQKLTLQSPSLT